MNISGSHLIPPNVKQECYALINTVSKSDVSDSIIDVLKEILLNAHKYAPDEAVDMFDSVMGKFHEIVSYCRERFIPTTTPSHYFNLNVYATVMYKIIQSILFCANDNSSSEKDSVYDAHVLDIDNMIINTIKNYDAHLNKLWNNDELSVECHTVTKIFIDGISSLIFIKGLTFPDSAQVYKFITVFHPKFYEMAWENVGEMIGSRTGQFKGSFSSDFRVSKRVLPSTTLYSDPIIPVEEFLQKRGYPKFVYDNFCNKIDNLFTDKHRGSIPKNALLWLIKSDVVTDITTVPDKSTQALYQVCKYEGVPYVLFVNPEYLSKNSEHIIISGMELIDDNESVEKGAFRRELSLRVPVKEKYEYVADEV